MTRCRQPWRWQGHSFLANRRSTNSNCHRFQQRSEATGGGADFSPDGRTLYWSGGDLGSVLVFDLHARKAVATISLNGELNGKKYEDSYAADVKASEDGRYLYCADVTNFRVAVVDAVEPGNDMIERIDLRTHTIQARERIVPSPVVAGLRGVSPSGMAVSPDGARLFVAETGINAIAVLTRAGGAGAYSGGIRTASRSPGWSPACVCFAALVGPRQDENLKVIFSPCAGWSAC